MDKSKWNEIALGSGVLREPTPDHSQLVLWVPPAFNGIPKHWLRIANLPGVKPTSQSGLCFTNATVIEARPRLRGIVGAIWAGLFGSRSRQVWLLPNGAAADQVGERRTGYLLVWAESPDSNSAGLIQDRFGRNGPVRQLSENLYLAVSPKSDTVAGREAGDLFNANDIGEKALEPRELANRLLTAAREDKNAHQEITALTDLAILDVQQGEPQRGFEHFARALALARGLQDRALESDVRTSQAMAFLDTNQAARARDILEQEVRHAQEVSDRYLEKAALDRLATVYGALGESGPAIDSYERALAIAKEVGDRHQQADILWLLAIQCARLGLREQAIGMGEKAITLFREIGNPGAAEFDRALHDYRTGDSQRLLLAKTAVGESVAKRNSQSLHAGKGFKALSRAFSAVKSMARFVGSGMKRVDLRIYRERVQTCATCGYHTGMRCRICGCFTSVKAWMPHEGCPAGKWPEVARG